MARRNDLQNRLANDVGVDKNFIESWRAQRDSERLTKAAVQTSHDFPLLPTSATDPLPRLPEEEDDKLSPAQRLAAAELVSGQSSAAAARAAGVSRRTVFTWRQQPDFKRAVDDCSREAMSAVVVRVRNLMLRATRVLSESMTDRDANRAFHAFRVLNSRHIWSTATAQEAPAKAE